ncbi:hypothetical protein BJV77DRAFT_966604 [Russula vinacea]|nr:hypothetical protein BJV77DRAFT_966604 [Russula vinacea]
MRLAQPGPPNSTSEIMADLEKSLQRFTSHYSQPRTLIKVEGEEIRTRISKLWSESDQEVFSLEMALVVNTITYALVNSRKTEWDTVRFADKAKNTKVTKSGREAEAD